jgi:hypothetical protein
MKEFLSPTDVVMKRLVGDEEVLVNLLDVQSVFDPSAHVVLYHKLSKLLAIDEHNSSGNLVRERSRLRREV